MSTKAILLCQAFALVYHILSSTLFVVLHLPVALARCCIAGISQPQRRRSTAAQCAFYEGVVEHIRKKPVHHAFKYPVRMAVVGLDDTPAWFRVQAAEHMSAAEARLMAGTDGAVRLLTHPQAAGYVQNPISVYYCYDGAGALARCIAEVTNTPWGERVTFAFNPAGDTVAKSLHVSPFMDMQGQWTLKAQTPSKRLALTVAVNHPEMGDFFTATLVAQRCLDAAAAPNERVGFGTLWRYGYEPQRVAVWIYWEALKLLQKGVPFFPPPSNWQKAKVEQRAIAADADGMRRFAWRPVASFPWKT